MFAKTVGGSILFVNLVISCNFNRLDLLIRNTNAAALSKINFEMTDTNIEPSRLFKHFSINSKSELSTCCDTTGYKTRRVKSKGGTIVLILNYLVTSIFYLLVSVVVNYFAQMSLLIPFGVTTAIAGWLTDAFIGRYKMIRCSVWIMWLIMVAVSVSTVIGQLTTTAT